MGLVCVEVVRLHDADGTTTLVEQNVELAAFGLRETRIWSPQVAARSLVCALLVRGGLLPPRLCQARLYEHHH